jgi:pyruvate dehydrogenase E1 component alpha subunit
MNKKQLIDFEKDIAELYGKGKIHAPIHLVGGNEDQLIRIFKFIEKGDWIFSNHRSHLHYLLSGGKPEVLKKEIIDGNSMHIYDKLIPFFTSAIVAGAPPIAVGVALGLKMKKSTRRVWCFVGDMAAECGITMECIQYSRGHDLPIVFVIEDNNKSVDANTKKVWGTKKNKNKTMKYKYKRRFPHHGTGEYIVF